jgi:hypothetical protein
MADLPPRPQLKDYSEAAIEEWLSRFLTYYPENVTARQMEDLKRVLRQGPRDGFEMALSLREWTADASLVEWLDGFNTLSAKSDAETAWVRENIPALSEIVPDIEEVVCYETYCVRGEWLKEKVVVRGIVTRIELTGHALVFSTQLGHVRRGLGTHGQLIPWEDLRSCCSICGSNVQRGSTRARDGACRGCAARGVSICGEENTRRGVPCRGVTKHPSGKCRWHQGDQ